MTLSLPYVRDDDWQTVRRNFQTLARAVNPVLPQARVFNSANITCTTGVEKLLTFDSERWDEGSLHSTSANTGRLTASITGLYDIGCCVRFASNATSYRYAYIRLNGATILALDVRNATSGATTTMTLTTQYRLAATDYVEVMALQNSGGNLDVEASANHSPEFWMHRVGGYTNQGA